MSSLTPRQREVLTTIDGDRLAAVRALVVELGKHLVFRGDTTRVLMARDAWQKLCAALEVAP